MTSEELLIENSKIETKLLNAIDYETGMYQDFVSREQGDDFHPDALGFLEMALEVVRKKELTNDELLELRKQSKDLPNKRVYYGVSVEWTNQQLDSWIHLRLMVNDGRW